MAAFYYAPSTGVISQNSYLIRTRKCSPAHVNTASNSVLGKFLMLAGGLRAIFYLLGCGNKLRPACKRQGAKPTKLLLT